jgi:lipopolysaccharide/colanic/teichoic acid biosynthesis glycosyltransferase
MIRALDILFSLLGVLFGLPVFLVVIILSLLDHGSPFFKQSRVGKNQQLFTLVKFRTMAVGTQSVGTHLVDPSSITRLGRFLRKTKLDELPQLFSVLTGQMSLVGPRPCLPNQTELIKERSIREVFTIRPGITGLAQVHDVDMSTPRKLARYDQIMVARMSLKLYMKILIATAFGKGRGDRVRAASDHEF